MIAEKIMPIDFVATPILEKAYALHDGSIVSAVYSIIHQTKRGWLYQLEYTPPGLIDPPPTYYHIIIPT